MDQPFVWQPLHPDVRPLLDDEYVAFHDKYMQYVQPDDTKEWDGSARTTPSLPYGGSEKTPVAAIEDKQLEHCSVRAFIPERPNTSAHAALPALLWFHGGGWAIGSLDSEMDFCSLMCHTANCVVVSVDYRLAPEHPFPAAVEDAYEALQWLLSEALVLYGLDREKIAIGGTSAGGNLATVVATEAARSLPDFHPVLLMLIVPVIDNTATVENIWRRTNAPWLTPSRMLWYRRMYLPDHSQWLDWRASPNLAPPSLIARLPDTFIAVAEQDLLADEGVAFGQQLQHADVQTQVKVYPGTTHSILALNVLTKGKDLMSDAVEVLLKAMKGSR